MLGFDRRSSESKIYEIGICYISVKQIALIRNINNDWLARNQVNVTRWSNTSICRLFQCHSSIENQQNESVKCKQIVVTLKRSNCFEIDQLSVNSEKNEMVTAFSVPNNTFRLFKRARVAQ